jgi:hypothetical protein
VVFAVRPLVISPIQSMGPFLYNSENVMEKPNLKMALLFHARFENKAGLIVSLLV